jgi:glyoxylase-like metal-dependent hydrolase (beta-lactamase superfamily II)
VEELHAGGAREGGRPGVRLFNAPGHTPGHAAYLVYVRKPAAHGLERYGLCAALLAPHPEWQEPTTRDGPLAVTTRKTLLDRVIAEKMLVCGGALPVPRRRPLREGRRRYAFTTVQPECEPAVARRPAMKAARGCLPRFINPPKIHGDCYEMA